MRKNGTTFTRRRFLATTLAASAPVLLSTLPRPLPARRPLVDQRSAASRARPACPTRNATARPQLCATTATWRAAGAEVRGRRGAGE